MEPNDFEDVLADEPLIIGDEPSTADLPAEPVSIEDVCGERAPHPASEPGFDIGEPVG